MVLLLPLIILGLIFGSLGSVIFFRLGELPNWKTLKGFLFGRSECRHCHHTLHVQDLIPLWSFFSQKGRCRYCKAKLSRWYPLLEIGTVVIFVGVWLVMETPRLGAIHISNPGIMGCVMCGVRLLFIIALYDFKEYELHLTASLLFLLLSFFAQWGLGYDLRKALQGMSIFFGVFLVIYFIGRGIAYLKYKKKAEGFGFGDVIRAGILGSVVQVFVPLSSAVEWVSLVATYLITACVFALLLSLFLRREKIPFLPAMNIAFVLLMLFGQQLLSFLIHSPSSYAFF